MIYISKYSKSFMLFWPKLVAFKNLNWIIQIIDPQIVVFDFLYKNIENVYYRYSDN